MSRKPHAADGFVTPTDPMWLSTLVDALARAGRLTEAELTFQKMHTYACYR